ncbi:MAG: 30S ribosomal protein S9 [Puniceicoccales bacterium]|jgi:small subunit ribosomal protein S9|nr:30S ribosomal protein S9 [Puniceicoccales bacterium]
MAEGEVFLGTGRRKTAVARVRVVRGMGRIRINGRDGDGYCGQPEFVRQALRPANLLELTDRIDISIRVGGGGLMGQAGAISHGIARALVAMHPEMRPALRKEGLLTRDPRMRERKKAGRPGARKRFQFSKR